LSHVLVYGAVTSGDPTGSPSTKNCTRVIGESSSMTADNGTSPVTIAPSAGSVSVTDGGICCTCTDMGDRAPIAALAHVWGSDASVCWRLSRLLPPFPASRTVRLPEPIGARTATQ